MITPPRQASAAPPWQELHDRRRQGIFLFPSLLTTGNLFCGFFSLLLTVDHRYVEAALIIFLAMIMDLLDGRVARLMKATSQFGVEYDSLADVVSFCVAPAFLLYSFALHPLGRAAWFGAFLFSSAERCDWPASTCRRPAWTAGSSWASRRRPRPEWRRRS